jgi:transaldolase
MSLYYLQHLQKITTVVADTGDIGAIEEFKPREATTNPSLVLSVAQQPQYEKLIHQLVSLYPQDMTLCMQTLLVSLGEKILSYIPGRVSIEVDARLSFDTVATVVYAQKLIELFAQKGIDRSRLLIKIAATWEGIQAAKQLEAEGIHCNLTLIFSFAQAVACAETGVTLISPFVGRIYDWYCENENFNSQDPAKDPGVIFVTKVYNYFKKFDYSTEIMGASFRNTGQIMQLTGCDLLTISPTLLGELSKQEMPQEEVAYKLSVEQAKQLPIEKITCGEKEFEQLHNADQMAKEKLAEGIDKFCADIVKLEEYIETVAQ